MAKQTFTTGQVLTAAQVNSLQANDFNQTVSAKTASYVLVASDKGTRIEFNTSGSVTCTVNTGLFDAGDTVYIQNRGAGVVTITAGTATVNTSASLAVNQWEGGLLYFISASAAIWYEYASTANGDITGVTAGTGISGGGTSGDVTITNTMATAIDAKGDLVAGTADNTFARLAVGSNGETLVADSSQTTGLRYNPQNALANPVINGGFDIWQRGTANVTTASVYTADRWQKSSPTHYGVSRQVTSDTTNLANIQYAARLQRTAGSTTTTIIEFVQSLESVNSTPFVGKAVSFSFYARAGANFSSTSNAFFAGLYSGTGTDQNLISGFTGQNGVATSTVTLTTTWQRFVITGTIPSTANQLGVYFNYTPTGTAGANDWVEVTGVQIDLGTYTASSAPTFRRSGGTLAGELAACQRYYYRIAEFQIAGGTQSAAENKVFFALNSFNGVQMRTTPTAAFESTPYVTNGASNLRTVTAVAVASKAMIGFTYDSTRLTDSYSYMINAADAGRAVSLSAEL